MQGGWQPKQMCTRLGIKLCRKHNIVHKIIEMQMHTWDLVGWLLVVFRINVDLAIFQPYLDLEAGVNLSLKIQVARPGIEPRSSCCSASQELNHSATAAPTWDLEKANAYTNPFSISLHHNMYALCWLSKMWP